MTFTFSYEVQSKPDPFVELVNAVLAMGTDERIAITTMSGRERERLRSRLLISRGIRKKFTTSTNGDDGKLYIERKG